MDSSIQIVLARQTDCVELGEMSRVLIEHGLKWRWKPSRILRLIQHRDCVVVTARDKSSLLGFAAMDFYEVHAHLNLLAVKPNCRRKGIGRELLSWLESSATIAGMDFITLEVRANNGLAITFYEKAGYGIVQLYKGYYNGIEDAYQMKHQLISHEMAAQRP